MSRPLAARARGVRRRLPSFAPTRSYARRSPRVSGRLAVNIARRAHVREPMGVGARTHGWETRGGAVHPAPPALPIFSTSFVLKRSHAECFFQVLSTLCEFTGTPLFSAKVCLYLWRPERGEILHGPGNPRERHTSTQTGLATAPPGTTAGAGPFLCPAQGGTCASARTSRGRRRGFRPPASAGGKLPAVRIPPRGASNPRRRAGHGPPATGCANGDVPVPPPPLRGHLRPGGTGVPAGVLTLAGKDGRAVGQACRHNETPGSEGPSPAQRRRRGLFRCR